MRGLGGDDMMFGGSGNDLVDGGIGKDTMTGGAEKPIASCFALAMAPTSSTHFAARTAAATRIGLADFDVHSFSAVLAHATQVGAGYGDRPRRRRQAHAARRHQVHLAADDFAFDSIGQSDFGGNARDDILLVPATTALSRSGTMRRSGLAASRRLRYRGY